MLSMDTLRNEQRIIAIIQHLNSTTLLDWYEMSRIRDVGDEIRIKEPELNSVIAQETKDLAVAEQYDVNQFRAIS